MNPQPPKLTVLRGWHHKWVEGIKVQVNPAVSTWGPCLVVGYAETEAGLHNIFPLNLEVAKVLHELMGKVITEFEDFLKVGADYYTTPSLPPL